MISKLFSAVAVALTVSFASATEGVNVDYKAVNSDLDLTQRNLQQEVPEGWTCAAELYFKPDVCVCNCGVLSLGCGYNIPVENCPEFGQLCSFAAECFHVPAAWGCNSYYFNASDGCDCACSDDPLATDPDCFLPDQTLYGCQAFQQCNATGQCEDAPPTQQPTPTGLPETWSCRNVFYNAHDGCDCACGAHDPDCEVAGAKIFNCERDVLSCEAGECIYKDNSKAPTFAPTTSYPTVTVSDSFLDSNPVVVIALAGAAALLAGLAVAATCFAVLRK